jgi:hypothetical protein
MHLHHVRHVLVCAVASLTLGAIAHASPLLNVTFTGDSPGNTPSTAPPVAGGVSTHPTGAFVTGSGANSVLVQNTYTDTSTGNAFGNGNVAVFSDSDPGGIAFMAFQCDPADVQSTGMFTISWDWMEDKGIAATSSFFIAAQNQDRSKAISSIFLDLGENGGNIRSANGVDFGAFLGTAARGVSHHMDWVFNLDESNFSIATQLYLDGNLIHTQAREPLGPDGASDFGAFKINSAPSAVGVVAFDNLQIQAGNAVPEPASGVLAALVLCGLSRHRVR